MRVLKARVSAAVGEVTTLVVCAADGLPPAECGALMAQVYSSGDDFPVVLVDGDLACASGIDPDAVIAALGER